MMIIHKHGDLVEITSKEEVFLTINAEVLADVIGLRGGFQDMYGKMKGREHTPNSLYIDVKLQPQRNSWWLTIRFYVNGGVGFFVGEEYTGKTSLDSNELLCVLVNTLHQRGGK